jgi:F0F1-type ATP synthase assembly protein I
MALQAVVGAFIGGLLDELWGTSPLLVLVIGGLGFASGLLVLWRAFLAAQSDDDSPPDNPGPR